MREGFIPPAFHRLLPETRTRLGVFTGNWRTAPRPSAPSPATDTRKTRITNSSSMRNRPKWYSWCMLCTSCINGYAPLRQRLIIVIRFQMVSCSGETLTENRNPAKETKPEFCFSFLNQTNFHRERIVIPSSVACIGIRMHKLKFFI